MKSDKNSKTISSSQLFSTKQSLTKTVTTAMEIAAERHYHVNEPEFQHQESDSSSTLPTEQAHSEDSTLGGSNLNMQNLSFQLGSIETPKKNGEDSMNLCKAFGNADYSNRQIQLDRNQSPVCISYPSAESYFGGLISSHGSNFIVYPQMMGNAPARVVLPLDRTGHPIYVNAKQYHAILRRRQTRAKLEAQNKIPKSKKPYLHESRHLHALKRARGIGGRFLNTKNMQQSKRSPQMHDKYLSLQNLNDDAYEPEIQHSESNCSDVSDIFNSDDIFQQPEFTDTISSFPIGANSHVPAPDDRLLLSTAT